MSTVLTELGREEQTKELLEFVNDFENAVVVVHGDTGSGKSWYVRTIGALWEEYGGVTVTAEGDQTKSHRDLFPLTYSMSALPNSWHEVAKKRGRKLATGLGSVLATIAAGISIPQSVSEGIIDLISGDSKEQLPFLSDGEIKALQTLKKLSARKPCLLIVDDYQWWDTASKDFISLLHSEQLRSKVKALSNLRTIFVLREQDDTEQLQKEIENICPSAFLSQKLESCTAKQFRNVLSAMGLSVQLDNKLEEQLFDLTGGHLKVVDRLISLLNSTGAISGALEATDKNNLLFSIIAERLSLLEEDAAQVLKVLKYASVVGKSFTRSELLCLTQFDANQIDSVITLAVDERLITRSRNRLSFAHDIVREAVQQSSSPTSVLEIYRTYSECLRLLAPGEYALRSDVHHQLKDFHLAAVFAVMAILKLDRGHLRSSQDAPSSLLDRVDAEKLSEVLQSLRQAHSCFRSAKFDKGIRAIESMPVVDHELLHAEADFLRCLNLMEKETGDAFKEAISRISTFEHLEQEEFELGIRFRLLKQQTLILAGDIAGARTEEAHSFKSLASRVKYDPDSAIKMHVANRKADAIYQPDVAIKKIERSIDYFRDGKDPLTPLYPIEFYKTLTNSMAVNIKLGAIKAANESGHMALELIQANPEVLFPRKDLLANNTILAKVRFDSIYSTAATDMKALSKTDMAAGESFLYKCNYVGLALLAGEVASTRNMLDSLHDELKVNGIDESYLLYYLHCHELTWQWFHGDKAKASELFNEHVEFISTLNWPSKPYVVQRSLCLAEIIESKKECDITYWDAEHLTTELIGPAWGHYGRGIPLCEIQFWSEI